MKDLRLRKLLWIPPPFWYVTVFLVGLGLDSWLTLPRLESALARRAGAVLILAAFLVIVLPAMWQFWRKWTTLGPPTVHRPRALITAGPYRFSRNPLYLALAIMYAGISLWAGRIGPLLLTPLAIWLISRIVIRQEEDLLEAQFGDVYRRYRQRVRRWL